MQTTTMSYTAPTTHSLLIGYLTWLVGFTGSHRFYYGRQISGTIWFLTLGLLGIGWLVDLFLIPSMNRDCDRRYVPGPVNYSVAWILLAWLGVFGAHRIYMDKVGSGAVLLICTVSSMILPLVGLFLMLPVAVCLLYDLWTLNDQISELNGHVAGHSGTVL